MEIKNLMDILFKETLSIICKQKLIARSDFHKTGDV